MNSIRPEDEQNTTRGRRAARPPMPEKAPITPAPVEIPSVDTAHVEEIVKNTGISKTSETPETIFNIEDSEEKDEAVENPIVLHFPISKSVETAFIEHDYEDEDDEALNALVRERIAQGGSVSLEELVDELGLSNELSPSVTSAYASDSIDEVFNLDESHVNEDEKIERDVIVSDETNINDESVELPDSDSLNDLNDDEISTEETTENATSVTENEEVKIADEVLEDVIESQSDSEESIDENDSAENHETSVIENLDRDDEKSSTSDESSVIVVPTVIAPAKSKAVTTKTSKVEATPKSNKSKKKGLIFGGVTLIALLAAGGIAFGISSNSNTVVPSALASSDTPNVLTNECESFSKAALNDCNVLWVPNDTVKRGALISQSIAAGDKVKKGTAVTLTYSSGASESEFPNLKNKTKAEAEAALLGINVTVKEIKEVSGENIAKGNIVSTSVEAGTKVKNGSDVILNVSNGKIAIPNWSGKSVELVEADAKKLGLDVVVKEEESEKTSGLIISQTPAAGETIGVTSVEVVVSKAFKSKDIKVPDVIGKSAKDAQIELATAGFRHIKTVIVKNNDVTETQITQTVPGAGQTGKSEENVVIIVSEPIKVEKVEKKND